MRTFPFTAIGTSVHAALTLSLFSGTLRVTTGPDDYTLNGHTFLATSAVKVTQIQYATDGTPTNADVRISPDDVIVLSGMARRGLLDGRPAKIELFDINRPDLGTYNMIPNASIGSAAEDTNGVVVLAIHGPLALLNGPITETHSLTCKARFGDDRCGIALDVPEIGRNQTFVASTDLAHIVHTRDAWGRVKDGDTWHNTVWECVTGGITHATTAPSYYPAVREPLGSATLVTDGTAVFRARNTYLVEAVGEGLDFFTIQLTDDFLDWLAAEPGSEPTITGNIIPQDGPLAGIKIPIRDYDIGTNIVTTFEPFAPSNFPAGTNFLIHRGCNKLFATCKDELLNKDNFRGVPYTPDPETLAGTSN